jgi:hypothetical protein
MESHHSRIFSHGYKYQQANYTPPSRTGIISSFNADEQTYPSQSSAPFNYNKAAVGLPSYVYRK